MVEFVELAILALEERWARREFRGMKMQEAAANISNYVSDGKTSVDQPARPGADAVHN